LPFALLRRAEQGYTLPASEIEAQLEGLKFPVCLKPCHLGSSIGVAKCKSVEEVSASLPAIFKYDSAAIVEPFVENLIEYNVAVARMNGAVVTSALERPKNTEELLDFKQKYLSGGDNKSGQKTPGQSSEGMLSLTRELNPKLADGREADIRKWAEIFYSAIDGTGAPRIDFIGNEKSGEIWMNEINPCPGSFGYFLWEAATGEPVLFTNLLTHLIEEALSQSRKMAMPADPVPMDARLHKRPT
jgi:D-alanine-D-alanine ligase